MSNNSDKKKLSKSPDRYSFQQDMALQRADKDGRDPMQDPELLEEFSWIDTIKRTEDEREENLEWQKNNLEYDLRSSEWILKKARDNENYAQNIYAALCNNEFIKLDIVPILTEKTWSCSWRYAGGVVAHMRQEGDYIDWYCSGIRNTFDDEKDNKSWDTLQYVPEGKITQEVREDFKRLGWVPAPGGDWEHFDE